MNITERAGAHRLAERVAQNAHGAHSAATGNYENAPDIQGGQGGQGLSLRVAEK